MKRFYKEASVAALGGGFTIELDGKPVRTPAKAALLVPSRALADGMAAEWQAQGDKVVASLLPLTSLANAAIDIAGRRRTDLINETVKYAETDLVCYRADHPPALVARQHDAWQPFIDWATSRFDAPLTVTSGVTPVAQPAPSLSALRRAVEHYDDMTLTALQLATTACGSLIVGLALIEGRIDAETAFAVAQLEETFEIEQWGEDAEQTKRRAALQDDIALVGRFVTLLRG
jgi:chaperone required for assembly of F1-ATPase